MTSTNSRALFTKIAVEGFKSVRDYTRIDLYPLTILAGANSSGKSSIMQPLLLLKQTFEAPYDRGPLLLKGPNVNFPSVREMLWQTAAGEKKESFTVGLAGKSSSGFNDAAPAKVGVEIEFKGIFKGFPQSFEISRCKWREGQQEYTLTPHLTSDEIHASLPDRLSKPFDDILSKVVTPIDLEVVRNRSVLGLNMIGDEGERDIPLKGPWNTFMSQVDDILHVPGLREKPQNSYDVGRIEIEAESSSTSTKYQFQGLFHEYFATLIAHWQETNSTRLHQIGDDLGTLGLTQQIAVKKITDTQVEIYVGQPSATAANGSDRLINITNVGFGVSQALPVVVSLLAAAPGQMVYLEQPELHLHPKAQAALAELLVKAVNRGVQVVVETHSEMLLRGVQRLVAQEQIEPNLVKLHWFSLEPEGATQVTSAELDADGAFGDWPVDFAEVTMKVMDDYLDTVTAKHAGDGL